MDLIKSVTNKDYNATITILVAWLIGFLAVFLVAKSPFGQGEVFGVVVADIGMYGFIVMGMLIGATTGLANDAFKILRRKKEDYDKGSLVPRLVKPAEPPTTVPITELEVTNPDSNITRGDD